MTLPDKKAATGRRTPKSKAIEISKQLAPSKTSTSVPDCVIMAPSQTL
jgi:hypothetical protein